MENKNNNNGLLIGIIVILVVALLGVCAYVAYDKGIIFNSEKENNEVENNEVESNESENNEEQVETEITDTIIKDELEQKVAIIEYMDIESIDIKNSYWYPADIYYNDKTTLENLDSNETLYAVLKYHYAEKNFTQLTTDYDFSEIYSDKNYWSEVFTQISSESILNEHNKLFKNLSVNLMEGTIGTCPSFTYDATNKLFYGGSQCGGISLISTLTYINKYTQLDNNVYVYVSVGTMNGETNYIYTDYKSTEPYRTLTNSDNAQNIITAENYTDFSEYKYTFSKNTDGSYSFIQVERVK